MCFLRAFRTSNQITLVEKDLIILIAHKQIYLPMCLLIPVVSGNPLLPRLWHHIITNMLIHVKAYCLLFLLSRNIFVNFMLYCNWQTTPFSLNLLSLLSSVISGCLHKHT